MYIKDLKGATPVTFKMITIYCPPDCGGDDGDEFEYAAICPKCGYVFDKLDHDNFCRKCGTKLFWPAKYPQIK